MPGLTAKQRKGLSTAVFGLPAQRKYPVDTKARAVDAKARATQQRKKGNLSTGQEAQIDAKANKKLGKPKPKAKAALPAGKRMRPGAILAS